MSEPVFDGGPAFPIHYTCDADGKPWIQLDHAGMSLRDWFAGQALANNWMVSKAVGTPDWQSNMAWNAYSIADAMLAERSKAEASAS